MQNRGDLCRALPLQGQVSLSAGLVHPIEAEPGPEIPKRGKCVQETALRAVPHLRWSAWSLPGVLQSPLTVSLIVLTTYSFPSLEQCLAHGNCSLNLLLT